MFLGTGVLYFAVLHQNKQLSIALNKGNKADYTSWGHFTESFMPITEQHIDNTVLYVEGK